MTRNDNNTGDKKMAKLNKSELKMVKDAKKVAAWMRTAGDETAARDVMLRTYQRIREAR
jgi:hypothetical protein